MKYKKHPFIDHLKVSENGAFVKHMNIACEIKEIIPKPGYPLMVAVINTKFYSLPKLVLETWKGVPNSSKRLYARVIDGDHKNTHPDNLEWDTNNLNTDPDYRFVRETNRSKLSPEDTMYCLKQYESKEKTLSQLAEQFCVSDMSIHRAIKRAEKLKIKINDSN